jgi:bifunctional DNA-binding transcriptional regulator/antitoxin component of YhaV-PrlF toxin-antitoxin module
MAQSVRTPGGGVSRTKISSKHQVTIAKPAFDEAGLHAGDVVAVRAIGPGRVEMTNLDALFARYRGRLSGGDARRRELERLRDEWA